MFVNVSHFQASLASQASWDISKYSCFFASVIGFKWFIYPLYHFVFIFNNIHVFKTAWNRVFPSETGRKSRLHWEIKIMCEIWGEIDILEIMSICQYEMVEIW